MFDKTLKTGDSILSRFGPRGLRRESLLLKPPTVSDEEVSSSSIRVGRETETPSRTKGVPFLRIMNLSVFKFVKLLLSLGSPGGELSRPEEAALSRNPDSPKRSTEWSKKKIQRPKTRG